jgi:hypothetical protein
MCKANKIEIELEIVVLDHNIEKLTKLGFETVGLQSRLVYCRNQFEKFVAHGCNDRRPDVNNVT